VIVEKREVKKLEDGSSYDGEWSVSENLRHGKG
jgi:hypothetical protein